MLNNLSNRFLLPLKTSFLITLFFVSWLPNAHAVLPLPLFPDPAMQQCMDELAVQNGWQFAEEVTSFTCSDRGVGDIWGIDALPNLTKLDVSQNQIISISPLYGMTGLSQLNLSGNSGVDVYGLNTILSQNLGLTHIGIGGIPIGDLWSLPLFNPIAGQPYNLVELDLNNTQISDINRLGEFPGLQVLKLSGNQIFDINVLGMLSNLSELDLSNNQLADLSPLYGMTGLTQIDFSNNASLIINDLLSVLFQNPGLTHIGLGGISIAEMSSLPFRHSDGQPHNLVELNLSNTQFRDINLLSDYPGLQNLNLSGNQITDIFVLDMLNNLRQLDLSNNQISNIYPLFTQTGLTQIDLSDNAGIHPMDLFPILDQNRGLTKIGLAGIPVGDLWTLPLNDPFTGQPYALVELNLSNTQVSDINRLAEFPGLQVLKLSVNQVSDIFALDMMSSMQELDLSNNQVSDISPLFGMRVLTSIDLSNNAGINPTDLNPLLGQNPGLTRIGLAGIPVDLWSLQLYDPSNGQPYALLELDLSNTLTTDVTFLPYEFPGLQVLKLSGNQISDISSLSALNNLRVLDLSNNNIVDISSLSFLSGMTQLNLSNNAGINPGDLFPILDQNRGLTHIGLGGIPIVDLWSLPLNDPTIGRQYDLVELNLSNTQISDINRLNEFPGLQNLNLSGNQITDISVLGVLNNLRQLDLSNNQISDISPLYTQMGLTQIDLSDNAGINPGDLFPVLDQNRGLTKVGLAGIPVGDLWTLPLNDPFTGQPYALVELNLSNTQISDINRLYDFPGLQVLNLSGNQISDIFALDMMPNMRELDLSNNQVSDISPLFGMRVLTSIDLSNNAGINPTDLNPLLGQNPGLTRIGLAGIPVDLWSLQLYDPSNGQPYALLELDLSNTLTTDVTFLPYEFPGLQVLKLSGNQISDISSLSALNNLRVLDLSNNNIVDVLPLSVLSKLSLLNLMGNSGILCVDLDALETSLQPNVLIRPVICNSGNVAPQLTILSPSSGSSFVEGDLITLQALAMDNEDGEISSTIAWSSNVDGALGSGGNVAAVLSVGTHTLGATVTDSGGLTSSMLVTVIVEANVAPQVIIITPQNGSSFIEGDLITLQATASDNEDGDVTTAITWSSNIDGAIGAGGNSNVILSVGAHTIAAIVSDSHGESTSVSRSVVVDAKPTITITSPIGSPVVTGGAFINFQATASDAEDGDLSGSVRWSSNLDGLLGFGIVSPVLTVGVHIVTATVTDSAGSTVSTSTSVTINAAPSISIVAPLDGHLVNQPVSIVFEANALDAEDGDISANIQWTSNIDGSLGSGRQIVKWLTPGLHRVTAVIVDSDGASRQSTVNVRVNSVPTVKIYFMLDPFMLDPDARYTENELVAFSGTALDLEDGPLPKRWKSNIDGDLGTFQTLITKLSPGLHTITGFAIDSDGGSGSDSIILQIYGVPKISIDSPINGAIIQQGKILPLIASASDSEDGDTTASIQWTSSIDGALGAGGTASATLSAGTHLLTATVTDSDGFSASVSTNVIVNVAPQLLITAPSDGSQFVESDAVTLQASATDNEDGDVTTAITWTSSIDGAIGTGGGSNVILSVGTHTVTASVTDSHGATSSMSATVVVNANVAPQVSMISPTNGASFVEGDAVTLQASATDNEDGDVTTAITWTSSIDGAIGTGGGSNVILSVGTHTVTASVTDSHGATSSMSATVVVNANVAPQVSLLSPNDGSAFVEGDAVTLQATASDNEDGDVTTAITWTSSIDGAISTGGGSNVILSVGTHTVTANVTDSHGATSSMSATVVVNANVAPQLTMLSPSNGASFVEGSVVTLQATASDNEDGDVTSTITWSSSIDGALGVGGNRNVILSVDTHAITATVTDSHGLISSAIATVVVNANVAPQVTILSPTNGAAYVEGDVVTLQATASDNEDGDVTTAITWSSNIDGAIGTGGNSNVILSVGTHTLTVSVTDSHGLATSVVATVVVEAAPPVNVAPTADAGSDQVVGSRDRVYLDGSASSDSDGNIVSYRWTQVSGRSRNINNADEAVADFRAPRLRRGRTYTLVFELEVTDDQGAISTDQITVEVR